MERFDPKEAIEKLANSKKAYMDRLLECLNKSVEKNDYETAANYIIAASLNLMGLNGSLDYLDVLSKTDEYPEFKLVFDY